MSYYAVKDNETGKYLSRARFDATFNAAFQLDHPELWSDKEEADKIAKDYKGTVIPFVQEG